MIMSVAELIEKLQKMPPSMTPYFKDDFEQILTLSDVRLSNNGTYVVIE